MSIANRKVYVKSREYRFTKMFHVEQSIMWTKNVPRRTILRLYEKCSTWNKNPPEKIRRIVFQLTSDQLMMPYCAFMSVKSNRNFGV